MLISSRCLSVSLEMIMLGSVVMNTLMMEAGRGVMRTIDTT